MTGPKERLRVPVAVHVFMICDDHILMLRRANTGYADGLLSVPAGHLDGDETVTTAAIRETSEEVGVSLLAHDIRPAGVMHRREDEERIDFFVTAARWTGDVANCEPQKCSELRWAPLASLPGDTVPYVQAAIAAYRRGEWFTSFGWPSRDP